MRRTTCVRLVATGLVLALSSSPVLAQQTQTPAQEKAKAEASAAAAAYSGAVEPEARAALDRMGTALRQLSGFTIHSDVTSEMVLDDGQKIQSGGTVDFTVQRPNGLKIVMASDRQKREIYYNGKTVTIFSPALGYYGTFDAPDTIGLMLDAADRKFGLELPLADLFKFGTDQTMTERIKSGFVVGSETIGGQMCVHYAFRQEQVDWQVWIRKDETALPCKIVITTTSDTSMPQYTSVMTWNTQATPDPATFSFTPPADAKKITVAEVKTAGQ
ncbi:MAG: DUF2092 domain-containing protein [Novosphingobium sp.]